MKVYIVVSNRGFVEVFASKEDAEKVAKEEQSFANMCGNYEDFSVKEKEVR